jgi:hypothetical protein
MRSVFGHNQARVLVHCYMIHVFVHLDAACMHVSFPEYLLAVSIEYPQLALFFCVAARCVLQMRKDRTKKRLCTASFMLIEST